MKVLSLLATFSLLLYGAYAQNITITSPDKNVVVNLHTDSLGFLFYNISLSGVTYLEDSPLGLSAKHGDFRSGLKITDSSISSVKDEFEMTRIKANKVIYEANVASISIKNAESIPMNIEFSVGNNDIAFRYLFPKSGETGSTRIFSESSGFRFPYKTTSFMCPQSDAMIGWKRTKPSYEEEYTPDGKLNRKSEFNHGFTFPCLFHLPDGGWALISETGVDSRFCASHLSNNINGTFFVEYPMATENNGNGTPEPAFALPGKTPWRTITIGKDLKPIVEGTITWALAEPQYETAHKYEYGKGTWSWILWQDNSINYEDQIKYIDLSSEMGFKYVLIDNWWDTNIGHDKIEKLVEYARTKNIDVFLWYASSGYWNDIVQGPINMMDRPIIRKQQMRWMQKIGVKGIKVDFFAGDKQETMRLYEDILSDADDHGLMVIFHGCTLPRGWERMYPNYVGSEAVLASENMIFSQDFCDKEGFTTTLHPFIRNAVGSMEYGGCFLNRHMSRDNKSGNTRRTSDVFQLSTCILFQNVIQNFAIAPNNLKEASPISIDFLKEIPTEWDETRFIEGYPGKYVVLARRYNNKWYLAATNGEKIDRTITIDVTSIFSDYTPTLICEDKDDNVVCSTPKLKKGKLTVTIRGEHAIILK
ncbi:MAG: glycoside hydrolase family 97 catalytic domain-containing protein [Marinilabiliaceae bacterium]|nr:glycoside hydrolase family 97 catalytic domain-containing protein [Marinilabiliaceae bacterium]